MNLIGESSPRLNQAAHEQLSCLIRCGGREIGIDRRSGTVCSISEGGVVERQRPARLYARITYCPQTCGYFAICQRVPDCIFALDSCFQEIDCIRISLDPPGLPVEDIWYDGQTQLLWLVTGPRIFRFNCNGDLLGAFLTAPPKTEYKAVCTYHKFVFAAFARGDCTFIASYTGGGAYLERISIGNGYAVCNLQVAAGEAGLYLQVFAIRDYRFPVVLQVELSGGKKEILPYELEQDGGFCVEYGAESPELRTTCRLSTPCPRNAPQNPVIG